MKFGRKRIIDQNIKQIFKNETKKLIQKRLPYWSKITKVQYNSFKIGDAISKYGSCIPSTKALHFSNRLIMLPPDKIDAIIVHELCHLKYKDHSKNFYNLVKEYMGSGIEKKEAIKRVAKVLGVNKNEVYKKCLEL